MIATSVAKAIPVALRATNKIIIVLFVHCNQQNIKVVGKTTDLKKC
ncbi:MAG: hypothetical protein H8D34_10405 [Chloroflexi bacterium]|nr:hypothetical protein [Chloroflexota bacterium]